MRGLLPFIGAIVAALAFIGLGAGGILPGGLRLHVPNGSSAAVPATAETRGHGGTPAPAAAPLSLVPPPNGSTVKLATQAAARPEWGYLVSVQVTSPAGKPVNDAVVRFYDIVDFFGPREELIGSGVTDGQGRTAITYLPATTGAHQIVARFAGRDTLVPSFGVTTLDATVAAPAYELDEPAFELFFTRYVPYAAGIVVLAVWGLIAFSLLSTARGVVAGADTTDQKGETA
ncbi:MAG TPA: hypothetical protein VFC31_15895 [Candidatus Limnocylindria bacterium]|nr:hypothetical protein [Candidatus Limnocylindria bacterium]